MSDEKIVKFPKKKQPRPIGYSEEQAKAMSDAAAAALLELAEKKGTQASEAMRGAITIADLFTGDDEDSKH